MPEDVAVAGIDDMSFASVGPLQLTTVSVPREQMGRRGVQLPLRRIEGDSGPSVEEVLPHRLRVRDTG